MILDEFLLDDEDPGVENKDVVKSPDQIRMDKLVRSSLSKE